MAVMLPPELEIAFGLLGVPWLTENEDELHDCAARYRSCATTLTAEVIPTAHAAVKHAAAGNAGNHIDALTSFWAGYHNDGDDSAHLSSLAATMHALSDSHDLAAMLVEVIKRFLIVVAAYVAAVLVWAALAATVTGAVAVLQAQKAISVLRVSAQRPVAVFRREFERFFGKSLIRAVEIRLRRILGASAPGGRDHGANLGGTRTLSPRQIEELYGIPERNQRMFQHYADSRGLTIDVRPTNPDSVAWLRRGALPKPEVIKTKTINQLDVRLGAGAENKGLVGFFEPKLPKHGSLPENEWNALVKRYEQRKDEHALLRPKMDAEERDGNFAVRDGVVHGVDRNGDFQPITGDHDMFDIRRPDGSRLSANELNDLVSEMQRRQMGIEHGPHLYWAPKNDFERNIHETIIRSHQPGGEPLVRFEPGGSPYLVDSGTPVGTGEI